MTTTLEKQLNKLTLEELFLNVVNGLFEKVAPITSKNDFIEFLKNYDDEDIKKVLKTIKGDL